MRMTRDDDFLVVIILSFDLASMSREIQGKQNINERTQEEITPIINSRIWYIMSLVSKNRVTTVQASSL